MSAIAGGGGGHTHTCGLSGAKQDVALLTITIDPELAFKVHKAIVVIVVLCAVT